MELRTRLTSDLTLFGFTTVPASEDRKWFGDCSAADVCVVLLSASMLESTMAHYQISYAADIGRLLMFIMVDVASHSLFDSSSSVVEETMLKYPSSFKKSYKSPGRTCNFNLGVPKKKPAFV